MTGPICNSCGYPLRLVDITEEGPADPTDSTGAWYWAGAHFECTHCEQQAHARPDGTGTMTIATLTPIPRTPEQHHESADVWAAERLMFAGMRCAARYTTREEYDEEEKQIAQAVEKYKAEHPLRQSFWKRAFARI